MLPRRHTPAPPSTTPHRIDRRRFLRLAGAGSVGVGLLLAGCGSDDGSGDAREDGDGGGDGGASRSTGGADGASGAGGLSGLTIVKRFADTANTPGALRLPITFAAVSGALVTSGPDTITGRIVDDAGADVATFSAARHDTGIPNPYWPIRTEIPAAGIYTLLVDGGPAEGAAIQLFDPAEVRTPAIGAALPAFDTPTVEDPRGVEPICTLTPEPCPFHGTTLTDALASGKHVVYMVGTPAHCQFGTCAPGLEFMVEAAPSYPGTVFVHAEVYADDTATAVAPAVKAANLDYEPVVYITDTAGVVVDRLDVIWDRPELDQVLGRWVA